MPPAQLAKIQHYVPRMLLKSHTTGKKHQIHVFDKLKLKSFQSNIKSIVAENGFYNFDGRSGKATIEPALAELENATTPILDKIIKIENITKITAEERTTLSLFLAVQLTRTKSFREMLKDVTNQLGHRLKQWAINRDDIEHLLKNFCATTDNDIKSSSIQIILSTAKNFAREINSKLWLLQKTKKCCPFIIGDNPIVLQNTMFKGCKVCGELGLSVRGIEIYFPISPTLSLMMLCPSYKDIFSERHIPILSQGDGSFKHFEENIRKKAKEFRDGFERGTPIQCLPQHVENHNSLQIVNAEQYIMSSNNDFSLALKMLHNNPKLKTGPRMKLM